MKIGEVQSVDTGNVVISVSDDKLLNSIQVNQIAWIRSTKMNEKIIGLVSKIMRRAVAEKSDQETEPESIVENVVRVNLVGTWIAKEGNKHSVFKRTLNTVPSVGAEASLFTDDELTQFMGSISTSNENPLCLGQYAIAQNSAANIDGNKFFQRHAVIVGGTGSGKSWTVASVLEKAAGLKSVDAIVFDLHGEYAPLGKLENAKLMKIAGPAENAKDDDVIFLPYWLLCYDEMEALLLDRSDMNAPNQARALFDSVLKFKNETLSQSGHQNEYTSITIDSPLPYDIENVVADLNALDKAREPGARPGQDKAGPLNGKLTRFLQRLRSKRDDKRLNFIFNSDQTLLRYEWFEELAEKLIGFNNGRGLKIIDFSEVPSDILPLIAGLVARLIFSLQQWMEVEHRHPVALFCDEAHLYIPDAASGAMEERGLKAFERIAKEGRKYGVALIVISQRPADVNKTVLSQCGNFIAMRLSNPDDQSVIKHLFPDNMGDFAESLPILDIGEGLIVGDACLLPSRVKINPPTIKPESATIDFWDEWAGDGCTPGIANAVLALRRQQK